MLTVLTELGKKISERWLSLLVVPGFLFVCAVANAAWLGHGHALDTDLLVHRSAVAAHGLEHRPAKVVVFGVLLLLAATGVGIVAAGVAGVVNRVWLDQVRLSLSWLDRRDRLQRLRSGLVAWRRRRDERMGRPGRPPQYLPARVTWIGDRVRLTDERVRYQYGMHVALVWPRLWLVTSDVVREHVQAAYDRYTAATGLAGWAFLYLSLGLRWWPAAVVGVIAGGVAWRRARTAIEAFCLLAEAAIDTHQQQLATSLGITLADGRETMTWSGLARDAAACALQCGDATHAIELLEHGRSVLWSRVSGYRTDLRALFAVAPELAGEVERVRRGLDLRSTSRLADLGAARDEVGAGTGERLRLAEEWQDLIRRVKQIPGFEEFLEPPLFAALAPTDLPGPVVVINISRFRCDALVVKAGHVRVISLPGLDQNMVIGHANRYFEALRAYFDAETRDPLLAVDMEQRLSDVLEWMWDEVMEPILSDLTAQTPSSAPQRNRESISRRVWWCPTGPLAVLPLHAAGHHDPSGPPGRAVIDHVVSSYVV